MPWGNFCSVTFLVIGAILNQIYFVGNLWNQLVKWGTIWLHEEEKMFFISSNVLKSLRYIEHST